MKSNESSASSSPAAEALERARITLTKTHEEIAHDIAWALQRELKALATDRERERLADAIEEFLR